MRASVETACGAFTAECACDGLLTNPTRRKAIANLLRLSSPTFRNLAQVKNQKAVEELAEFLGLNSGGLE